jgi:hypothetical protein
MTCECERIAQSAQPTLVVRRRSAVEHDRDDPDDTPIEQVRTLIVMPVR